MEGHDGYTSSKACCDLFETPTNLRDLQQCLTQRAIMSQEVNNMWDRLGQHLYYRNDSASMSRWISARATHKTHTIHTPSLCRTTHHMIQCVDLCAATSYPRLLIYASRKCDNSAIPVGQASCGEDIQVVDKWWISSNSPPHKKRSQNLSYFHCQQHRQRKSANSFLSTLHF